MGGTWKHYVKWNESDRERQSIRFCLRVESKIKQTKKQKAKPKWTHRKRDQTYGYQGQWLGMGELGEGGQRYKCPINKINITTWYLWLTLNRYMVYLKDLKDWTVRVLAQGEGFSVVFFFSFCCYYMREWMLAEIISVILQYRWIQPSRCRPSIYTKMCINYFPNKLGRKAFGKNITTQI